MRIEKQLERDMNKIVSSTVQASFIIPYYVIPSSLIMVTNISYI